MNKVLGYVALSFHARTPVLDSYKNVVMFKTKEDVRAFDETLIAAPVVRAARSTHSKKASS